MFRYGAPLLIAVWISREAQPTEHNAPKHGNAPEHRTYRHKKEQVPALLKKT